MESKKFVYYYRVIFFIVVGSMLFFFSSCNLATRDKNEELAGTSITVRNLPASISSIELSISGEGMETIDITDIDTAETGYTVELPAGLDRTFEVRVRPGTGNAVKSFFGSVTEDLTAGETIDVAVSLEIEETRILIPDAENYRLVMIDDIQGTGWRTIKGTDIGFASDSSFYPSDVDIDQYGRIYIANAEFSNGGIVRIDDFNGNGKVDIFTGAITQLSIDKANNKVVFVDANSDLVRSCDYDGNGGVTLVDLSGYYLYGLSLDSDGTIYLANRNPSFNPLVSKFSPTGTFIKDYTANLSSPEDTLVWEDTVLVANNSASSGYFLIQLDKDLNYITGFGSADADGQNPQPVGEFFGPTRFLAVLNRKITLMDTTGTYGHSLVSMDDMTGTGWETYGQTGTGVGEFHFFGYC